jgi:ABC-2 type transport system permease protein
MHNLQSAMRKARALLVVWFAHMSAYRAEIIIWILTGSVPLIMLAVWIGKAQANGGAVGGFAPQDFAAYFLSAWLSQQMIVAWVSWELDFQIRQGTLSPKLLRPLNVFWEHVAAHVAERLVRLPFMVLVLLAGLLLVPGTQITPDVPHALVYVLSINLAWVIRFQIAYCIGLLAFWYEQAVAFDELYFVIAAFLTGAFAPLEFYPPAVRAAIEWLPFPYLIYYPVRILNGALSWPETLSVLGVQLVWALVFWMLRSWLWRRGLRRYGAVGA